MLRIVSVFLLMSGCFLSAAERPKIPVDGVDTTLLVDAQGKSVSPREFFEKKSSDAACVADLARLKKEFRQQYQELQALKAKRSTPVGQEDAAIEAKYAEMDKKRDEALVLLEKCGECSTRPLDRISVLAATGKEDWYVSNGSCQIPTKDKAALKVSFEKVKQSLLNTKYYPKRAHRGFDNILEFKFVTPTANGYTMSDADTDLPATPFDLFVAVRGPKVFQLLSFNYFIKARHATSVVDPSARVSSEENKFSLEFENQAPTETAKLQFPEVFDYTASGKAISTSELKLPQIQGKWFLTDDGYIRYYTAAALPANIIPKNSNMFEVLGRKILIDSLMDLSERSEWDQASGASTP